MSTPEEFHQRMVLLAQTAADGADRVVRQCSLAIDAAVVPATPVDTNRARHNWIASLDGPTDINRDPAGRDGGQAAMDEASAVIARYDGDKNSSIHICNSVPYIGALNRGHSKQAPEDFVAIGVQAGVSAVAGAKILEDNGMKPAP